MKNTREKKILMISRGHYRGVDIFEIPCGLFAIVLGLNTYASASLTEITKLIDYWFKLKRN